MYIDTHCHLTDERYDDVDGMISDFKNCSIDKAITIGYDLQSSIQGVALSVRYENIFAAVAVHPHDAKLYDDDTEKALYDLCKNEKVVAVGEIGLDFYYDHSPRDIQEQVFIKQLKLAKEVKKPVVLHVRDAYESALKILQEYKDCLKYGGVLHCYSGSSEMLDRFLPLGLYVSFSGAVTFNNNKKADDCVKKTPIDKILIETDCPYLTPMPHRGETNYPKYIKYVYEKVADIYGMSVENLCGNVNKNVSALFGI